MLVENVFVGTRFEDSVSGDVEEYPVPVELDRPQVPEAGLEEEALPADDGREVPVVLLLIPDGSKLPMG